jgi:hypothetical protein
MNMLRTAVLLVVMVRHGDASIAGGERRSAARVSGIGEELDEKRGKGDYRRVL